MFGCIGLEAESVGYRNGYNSKPDFPSPVGISPIRSYTDEVSLYIRNHSTRRYELTKLSTIYPMGTIFVLRYGTTWETLPQGTTFIQARVECLHKQADLITGVVAKPAPKTRPKSSVKTLDELMDIYLTTGKAAEENWRKSTFKAYTQALRLFRQSSKKVHLEEITADDLRQAVRAISSVLASCSRCW